ncbi:MAG: GNAT family N-acetyltransferase [Sphingobium sp.]|nr:GNAT family N-acetyltransferase [Sphingobium sp.]MDX3908734.1 GNAT family N-acetyltransferase [Sphingobium sp.]
MAPDPALKPGLGLPVHTRPGEAQDARWAALAEDAAEANVFYAPDMLRPALDHLRGERNVRLIEVFDGPLLIGLMPVTVEPRHGRLPVSNVANWMHDHCFYGAPLIRQGAEEVAWAGILAQLDAADWAPNFLHLRSIDAAGANAAALEAVCTAQARPFSELGRHDRALLRSHLSAEEYWDANVRPKKRKEIRRLQKRLGEVGTVESRSLGDDADLPRWCSDFLALEASGWKGDQGTALSCSPQDSAFFRAATAAAQARGHLSFLRLDLDGRPIAMLVGFRHGRGAFSFKIAIDETLGRFSPGVLIEIDNLHAVQGDAAVDWVDSCAAADHPMIDSLWGERRSIAQYRVALRGHGATRVRRACAYALAGGAERAAAFLKGR